MLNVCRFTPVWCDAVKQVFHKIIFSNWTAMKKIVILITGFMSMLVSNADSQTLDLLKNYENKKILSVVNIHTKTGPKSEIKSSGKNTIEVTINKSEQEQNRQREVLFNANRSGTLKISLVIRKMLMTFQRPDSQKSIYNSDNTFERDQLANEIGRKYDAYVNKIVSTSIDRSGHVTSQDRVEKDFKYLWTNNIPIFSTGELWTSGIIFYNPSVRSYPTNHYWNDTTLVDSRKIYTKYIVKAKNSDEILIHFKSIAKPPQSESYKIGEANMSLKDEIYEGDLYIDISILLIKKASILKISEKEISIENSVGLIQAVTNYKIENTIRSR